MWVNCKNDFDCFLKNKAIQNRWKNIIMEVIWNFTMIIDGKVMKIELLKNNINNEVMHNIKSVTK